MQIILGVQYLLKLINGTILDFCMIILLKHNIFIHLNGYLAYTDISSSPFIGASGAITIGAINNTGGATSSYFWIGYIDEVTFISQTKTASQVLDDATLVAYYSFDNGSFYDSGPKRTNGVSLKNKQTYFFLFFCLCK
jgi:hypothetical protein